MRKPLRTRFPKFVKTKPLSRTQSARGRRNQSGAIAFTNCLTFCWKQLGNGRFWVAIALIFLLLLFAVGPLRVIFDRDALVRYLETYREGAVVAFIGLQAIAAAIGLPGTILTVAGGLTFGLVWGSVWSVVGATLGALGGFWVSRYLLRTYAERKFRRYSLLARLQETVKERPFLCVLVVRFVPISPFSLVNYLFGLTPIHWLPYATATFIGIIPGTIAYTWLGVAGKEALQGGDTRPLFLAIASLVALIVLPICLRRGRSK